MSYPMPSYPPPVSPPPKKNHSVAWIAFGTGVFIAALGLVVFFSLTSGSASPKAQATAAVATTSATPTPTLSVLEKDADFYNFVQRHPWSQNGNGRDDWIDLANAMCGAFDRGALYDDVATILIDELSGFSLGDARDFIRKSVEVYCPEYEGRLQ